MTNNIEREVDPYDMFKVEDFDKFIIGSPVEYYNEYQDSIDNGTCIGKDLVSGELIIDMSNDGSYLGFEKIERKVKVHINKCRPQELK